MTDALRESLLGTVAPREPGSLNRYWQSRGANFDEPFVSSAPADDPIAGLKESLERSSPWHPAWAFLLQQGRTFMPSGCPRGVRKRKDKECFGNSWRYVLDHPQATYVEGYGLLSFEKHWAEIPHGWAVDSSGRVIDTTWNDPANCLYFGVPFSSDFVARTLPDLDHCSILSSWPFGSEPLPGDAIAHLPAMDESS